MLDTNPCLRIDPTSLGAPPITDSLEKRGMRLGYKRHACHSLREGEMEIVFPRITVWTEIEIWEGASENECETERGAWKQERGAQDYRRGCLRMGESRDESRGDVEEDRGSLCNCCQKEDEGRGRPAMLNFCFASGSVIPHLTCIGFLQGDTKGGRPAPVSVLQLKLQQRRTREELVSQGIMPPLKSPAAFHEQRKSLERARTEDYLKRKIRSRPERSELVRMHILEETSAEPSLQAKQLQLKRARLADDLNDKISHRPGPMELIHKNILAVHSSLKQVLIETEFPKVAGESSSFDEDSSDALSPDQPVSHDSPLGPAPLPSPPDMLNRSSNPSPTQFLSQAPPLPPPTSSMPSPPQKLTNGTPTPTAARPAPALIKQSQAKPVSDRPPQKKKPKESKPKVKKLKYHQYIPPDQKAEREPPPQLDSTYAKILHQQQLFLQLQIINQQQQHYNYHTILPAPPKPPTDQQPSSNTGPSPSRTVPAATSSSPSQSAQNRQGLTLVAGVKLGPLPPNLDDLKVAELKHELKLRGLPVSGTKNDLIERLRNFQEQNGGTAATGATPGGVPPKNNLQQQPQPQQQQLTQPTGSSPILGGATVLHQPGEGGVVLAAFPFVATVGGGGARTAAQPPVMQFGSTSSSPPPSPTPSDRSLAGMSPDETSCNGDAFGEMVTSPLTQLSLHPSPQHPVVMVKEESLGQAPATCRFSQHAPRPREVAGSLDKDQMLQEKDKQIEELTRMLRQKQRLVETLRLQLEQGKRSEPVAGIVRVKEEPCETAGDRSSSCCLRQPLSPDLLLDGEAIKVYINQQPCAPLSAPSFPLDLLKAQHTPTLVTDSNGNHFLIALTNHSVDSQASGSLEGRTSGPVRLQRVKSTPSKLSSQSQPDSQMPSSENQSKQQVQQPSLTNQPVRKGHKVGLHVTTNSSQGAAMSFSAPPNLQPFFASEDSAPCGNHRPSSPTHTTEVCSGIDQHTLFSPPSPPHKQTCASTQPGKENGSSQHMDDLFDILIQSGEISASFKADQDPAPSRLRPNTPPPSPSPSSIQLSPPTPPESTASQQPTGGEPQPPSSGEHDGTGSGRLEDFLESTTGKPLLGVEPGGPLTLIDDLHSQMLSTSSILDHPPSPMDTCDLSFTSQPPGLDFGDPVLDSMDWLDITMGGSSSGGTSLAPLNSHAPPSVFSADFLDSTDLQLHWDSCL
ncbi:hypothetical protein JZ751_021451 [Albula glossodonta]|uniref:SAP domain-containing protein n=1 Tax=Albula glossodonta TaxID=121402 RepID=A0A8T2NJC3_9TELE|nr:hypothetical protein JZ751_021451 [Albula glossodonta]